MLYYTEWCRWDNWFGVLYNSVGVLPKAIRDGLTVLAKYGSEAHLFVPGVGKVNGIDAKNYIESTFITRAAPAVPVGGVKNASAGTINLTQPTTASKPMLGVEPIGGRTNLLNYSEDYTKWNKINTILSFDSTVGMTKIRGTSASSTHYTNNTISITSGVNNYISSVDIKKGNVSIVALAAYCIGGTTVGVTTNFNFDTKALTNSLCSFVELPNSVFRIFTPITSNSGNTTIINRVFVNNGAQVDTTGMYTYVNRLQAELEVTGLSPQPYQRTLSDYESYEDGKESIYYWEKGSSVSWLSGAPLFDGTVRDYYIGAAFRPSVVDITGTHAFFTPGVNNTGAAYKGVIAVSDSVMYIYDTDGTTSLTAVLDPAVSNGMYTVSTIRLANTTSPKLNGVSKTQTTVAGQVAITPVNSFVLASISGTSPAYGSLYAACVIQATITTDEQTMLDTMLDYISGRVR